MHTGHFAPETPMHDGSHTPLHGGAFAPGTPLHGGRPSTPGYNDNDSFDAQWAQMNGGGGGPPGQSPYRSGGGGGFGGSSGFDMGSSNDMGYDGPPSTGYSPGTPLHEEAPSTPMHEEPAVELLPAACRCGLRRAASRARSSLWSRPRRPTTWP